MSNANPTAAFEKERSDSIATYPGQSDWQKMSREWMLEAFKHKYMYNFTALGRPIIQTPVDMAAFHEAVWTARPDLIIETGIAHGGSLIFSASQLALLDYCDAVADGTTLDPKKPKRRVLGLDIDIRAHNRAAIEAHPMANRIDMLQGSSTAPEIVAQVKKIVAGYKRILLCLDSNHTHEHVLAELEAYAPLTTPGSYCLVFDTIVEDMPKDTFTNRPWNPGNSPKTAVREYLKKLEKGGVKAADGKPLILAVDRELEDKLLLTVAPEGYLRRV